MRAAVAVAAPAPRTRPAPRRAPASLPRRPHLRVVARTRRRLRVPVPLLLGAATAAVLLALVVVHVMLAQSQLTLDRLNTQVDAAQSRFQQARLTEAQLAAPSRIIARAAQLGLVPPGQPPVAIPVAGAPSPTPGAATSATTR